MTASADLLPRLAAIIAGWERAEAIQILHAWVTDAGTWQVQWTEPRTPGVLGGGENSFKVSRLIRDVDEALKTHSVAAQHITRPGPTSIRVWTAEGQYLRWDAPAPAEVPGSARAEGVPA